MGASSSTPSRAPTEADNFIDDKLRREEIVVSRLNMFLRRWRGAKRHWEGLLELSGGGADLPPPNDRGLFQHVYHPPIAR
jgi:hypothetical protein